MTLLNGFTTQIKNLIIELYEVLPYNKEIAVNKTAIELIIKTNPRLLYTAFTTYIMPYKTEILTRDDNFFLSREVQPNGAINKQIVGTLNILKRIWPSLTTSTKDSVWLYFAVLIKLHERISAEDAV
tara:strand:+ start:445 stop:825 length:381 start_codon:yes stop_codon:yes gene_type:complete